MIFTVWKKFDEALSELEERVGLPDFVGLSDEIEKALHLCSFQDELIDERKARLEKAICDHKSEVATTKSKKMDETLRYTPQGQDAVRAKCAELSDAVRLALVAKDIPSAENALGELILDSPNDETTAKLSEDKDRVVANLKNEEDRKTAKCLKHVNDLSVVASCGSKSPQIVVAWAPESSGLATEYKVVREDMESIGETSSFMCATSPFEDTDVVCGVPYKYTVIPCYHGIVVEEAAAKTNAAIATVPITSLNIYGEGIKEYAIAHISWMLPAYDETVHLSMILERIHGEERHRVYEAECGTGATSTNKVETHGREFTITTSDEDVVAGETYSYELTLTVSGKVLEPIVREVVIAKLPELPRVTASCYYQEGRYRLHIEWPDGVSEVCLSASGMRPFRYTKEQFSTESVFLPYEDSVRPVDIQAIRRFGQKKIAYGPKVQVRFIDSRRTLQVSVERAPRSAFSVLKFWKRDAWGMRIRFDDGSPLPALNVAVENPGKSVRTFDIPVGDIKPDVFFPFPLDWNVTRGATIDVSISDGNSHAYPRYLTSQVIS